MFFIKKLISAFLLPLPLTVIILLVGLLFLWFTKKQKTGKVIASFGVILLIVFSYSTFSNLIILPLENSYPKYEKSEISIKYVAVLGGGSSAENQLPLSSWLGDASLFRLVEGITIYRKNPGSVLIFSGYGGRDKISNAQVMAEVAISLGVPKSDIITEPLPKDTYEEVLLIKKIVKDNPFALVTSAAHMRRAIMLFEKQNMYPVPAPTNFLVKKNEGGVVELLSVDGFKKANSAIHEYLGIIWGKIRGLI